MLPGRPFDKLHAQRVIVARMALDRFFNRYAELSLGPQPEALADLYAPTFIVGGPEGSHTFTNDAHFTEWLGQIAS